MGNVVSRNGGGDSAFWTSHYLAGEAFRYQVTQDPDALDNVRWAVRGLSFSVAPGEAVGVVGSNAAGKTTLINLVRGTLLPTEGTVRPV